MSIFKYYMSKKASEDFFQQNHKGFSNTGKAFQINLVV